MPSLRLRRVAHAPRTAQIVGVELCAGSASEILGVDLSSSQDEDVPLSQLWGSEAEALELRMAAISLEERVPLLEDALSERLVHAAASPWMRSIRDLSDDIDRTGVEALAARLGYSARQLQRRWLRHLGMTPKAYGRLVRARRVFAAIAEDGQIDWRALACSAGYADRSHMVREFGDMMGIAPVQLLRDLDFVPGVLGIGWLVTARGNSEKC